MKRLLAVVAILGGGCVTTGPRRHHHRTEPVEALLVVSAAALAMAVTAEPPPSPPARPVVADPRVASPDPTRPATFEGWVVAEDGRGPVAFTVVDLAGQGDQVRVLTNGEGHFRICRPLSPGHYRLTVMDESWQGGAEADLDSGVVPAVVVRARPAR